MHVNDDIYIEFGRNTGGRITDICIIPSRGEHSLNIILKVAEV